MVFGIIKSLDFAFKRGLARAYDKKSRVVWAELLRVWEERDWRPKLLPHDEFVDGVSAVFGAVRMGLVGPTHDVTHLKDLVSTHLYDIARLEVLNRESACLMMAETVGEAATGGYDAKGSAAKLREEIAAHPWPEPEIEDLECLVVGINLRARVDPIPELPSDEPWQEKVVSLSLGDNELESDPSRVHGESSEDQFYAMLRLESMTRPGPDNPRCFSAQPFSTEDDSVGEGSARPEMCAPTAYTQQYLDAYGEATGGKGPPDLFFEVWTRVIAKMSVSEIPEPPPPPPPPQSSSSSSSDRKGEVVTSTYYMGKWFTTSATAGAFGSGLMSAMFFGGESRFMDATASHPGTHSRQHVIVLTAPMWTAGKGAMGDWRVVASVRNEMAPNAGPTRVDLPSGSAR